MEKLYYSYIGVHKVIQRVSKEIIASGFIPDYIIAIGGGGYIPARILRTFLGRSIIAVTISRYTTEDEFSESGEPVKQQWLHDINVDLNGKKVLIVDEIDDSRTTLQYCIEELLKEFKMEIGVFVLQNKKKKKHGIIPKEVKHFFVGEEVDNLWVNYPWDALDIEAHDALAKNQNS